MDEEPDGEETRILAETGEPGGRPVQEDGTGAARNGLPPTIEPEGGPGPAKGPRPRWMVPVVAAVVVAVVAVAGLAVWRVASGRSHDRALAQCSRQVRAVKRSEQRVEAASSSYLQAIAVQTDQVKDAETVKDLDRAVGKAKDTQAQVFRCEASMSTGDLQTMAGRAKRIDGVYRGLDRASKAVLASRDAKSLDDAKAALDGKKDEAARLLGDSDGKVADNATRDGLQQAMSQAGQVKGGKAKAYQDAASALQSAIDQVNASMQQKSQADQAVQQQAQAAQQRSAQPAVPSYRPSYNRGGGGGSAPATAAPAPAPAAPQGGGISPDANAWMNTHTPSQCHAGGACGIG